MTLKSGNKPAFKMMAGESPITSPYKKEDDEVSLESAADAITDLLPKVNKTKTAMNKVGNTLVGAFTSGLDAVYGTGKVMPKGSGLSFSKPKKEEEEKEEEEFGQVKEVV